MILWTIWIGIVYTEVMERYLTEEELNGEG